MRLPLLTALGSPLLCAAAHAAAVAPASGVWYDIAMETTAATGGCQTVGEQFTGELQFIGGGKAGSQLLLETPSASGSSSPDVIALILPALPTTNGGTSTGSVSGTDLQKAKPVSGTFAVTLTWATSSAFFASTTFTIGSCSFTTALSAIHSGK